MVDYLKIVLTKLYLCYDISMNLDKKLKVMTFAPGIEVDNNLQTLHSKVQMIRDKQESLSKLIYPEEISYYMGHDISFAPVIKVYGSEVPQSLLTKDFEGCIFICRELDVKNNDVKYFYYHNSATYLIESSNFTTFIPYDTNYYGFVQESTQVAFLSNQPLAIKFTDSFSNSTSRAQSLDSVSNISKSSSTTSTSSNPLFRKNITLGENGYDIREYPDIDVAFVTLLNSAATIEDILTEVNQPSLAPLSLEEKEDAHSFLRSVSSCSLEEYSDSEEGIWVEPEEINEFIKSLPKVQLLTVIANIPDTAEFLLNRETPSSWQKVLHFLTESGCDELDWCDQVPFMEAAFTCHHPRNVAFIFDDSQE